jgi:predicted porin
MKPTGFALALLGSGIACCLYGQNAIAQNTFSAATSGHSLVADYRGLTDMTGPFQAGLPGAPLLLTGMNGQQIDRHVQYVGREGRGVITRALYSEASAEPSAFGGDGRQSADRQNRAWGISLAVEKGPFTLRAAHQNLRATQVAPAMPIGNRMEAKNSILAVNVQLGVGTVYAGYSASRGWGSSPLWNPDNPYSAAIATSPSTDSRDLLVGFAVPKGATTLLASFIRKHDRDLARLNADQFALGASCAVSRKTDFYATYSRIKLRPGSALSISSAGAPGSAALNLGMRHAF